MELGADCGRDFIIRWGSVASPAVSLARFPARPLNLGGRMPPTSACPLPCSGPLPPLIARAVSTSRTRSKGSSTSIAARGRRRASTRCVPPGPCYRAMAFPEATAALVGHDSSLRALLLQVRRMPLRAYWRFELSPRGISEVEVDRDAARAPCQRHGASGGPERLRFQGGR